VINLYTVSRPGPLDRRLNSCSVPAEFLTSFVFSVFASMLMLLDKRAFGSQCLGRLRWLKTSAAARLNSLELSPLSITELLNGSPTLRR
jgi:hypothetical protein